MDSDSDSVFTPIAYMTGWFMLQGVKPASYSKVSDPEIKEIIGECICHRWEER